MEKLGYRPQEAAEAMGVARDMIFKLLASGELKSFKAGRARIIPATEIKAYIARKLGSV